VRSGVIHTPHLGRTAPGSSHAESGAAGSLGSLCSLVHFLQVHELRGFRASCLGVLAALTAVVAVFWAPAGLDAQERTFLDKTWIMIPAVDRCRPEHEIQKGGIINLLHLLTPACVGSPRWSKESNHQETMYRMITYVQFVRMSPELS
jgi:hypothetical protein